MYSPKILNQTLDSLLAAKAIDFTPEIYSPEYSAHVTAHLDTLWDKEQHVQIRELDRSEQAFVDNELLLSRLHYPYFSRYTVIYNFSREVIPFRHNISQEFLLGIMSEMEEEGDPIMLQILKLRQLGLSSIIQRVMAHKGLFYKNADILCASYNEDETFKLLNDHTGLVYKNLPWWMLKTWGIGNLAKGKDLGFYDSGGTYCEFLGENTSKSKLTLQHGRMTSDLGRGTNPSSVHLTELPKYTDPRQSIESGLMQAIHEDPFLFVALESTAEGKDWWYDFWKVNSELWPTRKTRFRPIFIPWYLGTDVWPTEYWYSPKRLKALESYKPSEHALAHARKAKDYVAATPILRRHLGADWELPLSQLMFWEYSRDNAIAMKSVKKWLQEIGAADAEECFQLSGESVFPYELIESYKNSCENPSDVYLVEAKEINALLTIPEQSELAKDKQVIDIVKADEARFTSKLVPLTYTTSLSVGGKVLVWEPPLEGHKYTISYDDSEGIGRDYSAIEVVRHATWNSPAAQVAEWASNTHNAHDAWPILLSIAEFYAKYMRPNEEPLVAIEIAVKGATVQEEMRKRGWTKFYQRYSTENGKPSFKGLGWKTTPGTRQILLDTFVKAVKDQWLIIKSKWLVEELEGLDSNSLTRGVRIEAQRDYHDDRCLAIAIALMCSMSDLSPTSLTTQAERLTELKRQSSLVDHVTSAMASEDSSLLSFGSRGIFAPPKIDPRTLGNSWN